MLDHDIDAKSGSSSFDEIGTIAVHDPVNLDWAAQKLNTKEEDKNFLDINLNWKTV